MGEKMDKKLNLKMLEELTLANGVSGFEDEAVEIAKTYLSSTLEVHTDSMLNTYIRRGKNNENLPTVMLDAHIDEVGFIVQSIKENGLIRIIPLGGFVAHNLPSHRVKIRNAENKLISGIITGSPVHYKDKKSEVTTDSLFVDVGAVSIDEVKNIYKIGIAMPVTLESVFEYDEETDIVKGKAFDCRAGVCSVIEMMNALEKEELAVNIVGTLTSQEEVGTRGIQVAVNKVKPDIAIVMEGTPADDTFGESYQIQTRIKKGPMLRHMDPKMIANPRFQRFALDIAKKYDIACQDAVRTGGGTNGMAIHTSNDGVPTIVIGVPVRYPHTSNGIIAYQDYENMVKLATAIIRELNRETVQKF
jgi:M42 family peptidase